MKEIYWEHNLKVSEQYGTEENARYEVLALVLLKSELF
jgi:hypothetical protein